MRTIAGRCLVFGAVAALGACAFSVDSFKNESNRAMLNKLTTECMQTRGQPCFALGDHLVGKTFQSRESTWREGRDPAAAKRAYQLCCASGLGECCRAIREHKLFDSPEEGERYQVIARFFGSEDRAPEEIAAEEARTAATVEKNEASNERDRAAERAANAQSLQAGLSAAENLTRAVGTAVTAHAAVPTPVFTPAHTARPEPVSTRPPAPATTSPPTPAAPRCATLRQDCGPTLQCCKVLGTADVQDNVSCTRGQCCINSGHVCLVSSDCCDAPDVVCDPKTVAGSPGPSLCCLPHGKSCSGSSAPCCSGDACVPSTGKCG